MKVEIGFMQLQAEECYRLPATHQKLEKARKGSSELSEGAWHCQHLYHGCLASRTVRQ